MSLPRMIFKVLTVSLVHSLNEDRVKGALSTFEASSHSLLLFHILYFPECPFWYLNVLLLYSGTPSIFRKRLFHCSTSLCWECCMTLQHYLRLKLCMVPSLLSSLLDAKVLSAFGAM